MNYLRIFFLSRSLVYVKPNETRSLRIKRNGFFYIFFREINRSWE